jgi:hypothetical protein
MLVRWVAFVLLFACGPAAHERGDGGRHRPDGGATGPDATDHCASDADCDDGSFCNGDEVCDPAAGGRGCVAGRPRCPSDAECDEDADLCMPICRDADRDGHRASSCGGDDCDDRDAAIPPGGIEVCDRGHDEDCDPGTLGDDEDGDGFPASSCCNGFVCGADCNDFDGEVYAGRPEDCNERDDDCDSVVDEHATRPLFLDLDRDGYGAGRPVELCPGTSGYTVASGDCNDAEPAVHPGAFELCDAARVDENCDGVVCEGCTGMLRPCSLPGRCAAGVETCIGKEWSACSIAPIAEICENAVDDDCDGAVDDGC